jgi:hypothetical protein
MFAVLRVTVVALILSGGARIASVGVFLFMPAPLFAQERLFRSVDAAPGKQIRLGLVGNVTPDCKIGAKPEVKVVSPPKHGVLAIRSGKTKPGSLARCPSLEVPAEGVFYQAPPKFSGSDEVVYQVTRPDGRNQVVTVKIGVRGAAEAGQKLKEEPPDL